ncbi:unnamed protein product [Miscanthus lutarioriparius]|uniref:Protein XRI1 n=1 Tax=Miscanthus lutarioriparius TaxID=422564 RepID=A0A811PC98_9POAL|nr:unnamed protein product [Miscanthus lutarioriparius]
MALDTCSYDCCVLPPLDCLDWGWDWDSELLHTHHYTLGGAAAGAGGAAVQAEPTFFPATATPGVQSPASSEASGGYLHDAVAHWSDRRNKRQRMAAATTSPPRRRATVSEDLQCLLAGFWDSSADSEGGGADFRHDLNTTTTPDPKTEILRCSFVSGEDGAGASGREEQQRGPSAQVQMPAPAAAAQEANATVVVPPPRVPATVRAAAPPLQLQKAAAAAGAPHAAARRDDRSRPVVDFCDREHPSRAGAAATTAPASACPSSLSGEEKDKEKRGVGVLYPFAVVKPLGLDDGSMTTLDDVNQRILKRPARPVRHPVGPFACGPAVSAHGLGLSGKAVVSLTKIRTGGNGTITIIRTRG